MQFVNISEMNIIKSANESDAMLDSVLDIIDTPMFLFHHKEFEMLKAKDANLQGQLLRDDLTIYEDDELLRQAKMLLVSHYERQIQSIVHSEESYERKSFGMKKIKGLIFGLKKELAKTKL